MPQQTLSIDEVRVRLASIPHDERCSETCPGWCLSDSDRYGLHVERCDECCSYLDHLHKRQWVYDDDVAQLPEARAELTRVLAREGNALTDDDLVLVGKIREICSRELSQPPDFPFFNRDRRPRETIDHLLVRVYRAARADLEARGHNPTLEQVVLVLCHG